MHHTLALFVQRKSRLEKKKRSNEIEFNQKLSTMNKRMYWHAYLFKA